MRIISDIGRFADEVQARIERASSSATIAWATRWRARCQPRRPGASPVDCFAIQNFAGSSVCRAEFTDGAEAPVSLHRRYRRRTCAPSLAFSL
jgi:hypothetical protein